MFPDLFNATVNGQRAVDQVDEGWYADEYIPKVGKRGAAIIEARGASSAASAANAALDHVRDWVLGADGLRSMAVRSDGSYGVEEGLISSFPVRVSGGSYEIAQGLDVGDFARERIDRTVQELKEERDAVQQLGLLGPRTAAEPIGPGGAHAPAEPIRRGSWALPSLAEGAQCARTGAFRRRPAAAASAPERLRRLVACQPRPSLRTSPSFWSPGSTR